MQNGRSARYDVTESESDGNVTLSENEMSNLRIYVYTTPAEKLLGNVKIGQTDRLEPGEQGVRARIEEQFGTANSSKDYELLAWWPSTVTDHELHEHRILKPLRVSRNREWFGCDLELVKRAYNDLVSGVDRPDSYGMRPEQEACVSKAVGLFGSGGTRFLVDAKMRFGKTHVTYRIAKALAAERVLILTYKPAVEDSWRSDLERHVAFEGMTFRRTEEGDGGPGIYFSSMQGILADDRAEATRRDWIYATDWDLVVFDEEHYGTRSELAESVKSRLHSRANRWLFLSGTPFQARLSGEFSDEQTFTWSYEDEQRAKRAWEGGSNPYSMLPDISFHTYEFGSKVLDVSKLYSDDEQFRMAKMFAARDGAFENPGMVGDFLDLLAGQSDRARPATTSPWHSKRIDRSMLDHSLWMLPSVAACDAMEVLLRKHPKFREFEPINVAGSNETRLDNVRATISRNERTITLSCGRFTTGVTVPEWGSVFFMDDGRSPTTYYQTAFRSQSPWIRDGEIVKRECYVVDFNPHRLLEMVYTLQASVRDKETESIESRVRSYLDCAPIYLYDQTSLRTIDVGQVMSVAIESRDLIGRFGMAQAIDLARMGGDASLVSDLMGVDPARAESIVKTVTDAGVAKGKVSETEGGERKKPTKEERKEAEQLRERVQTVLRRFPTYLHVTPVQEVSCRDVLSKGDGVLFRRHVGIDLSTFARMIELRVIDEDHLDNCIVHFNIYEDRIMGDTNGGRA